MVGLEGAVDLGPRHLDDLLVGKPEMMEQHGAARRVLTRGVVGGQLDRAEHGPAVALGHQERASLPRRGGGEVGPVDDADPDVDGIHAEAVPGQVEERGGGDDVDRHPGIGPQQHDGALGHERRAGHGVGDVPGAARRPGRAPTIVSTMAP